METNKLYLKIGIYTNEETQTTLNNCVIGYFICYSKSPYRAKGCNFIEREDFENAVIIDNDISERIEINKTQYIDGNFYNLKNI